MEDFFKRLTIFLDTQVLPIQHQLDSDAKLLSVVFEQLANLDALKLMIPKTEGGLGGERPEWIRYNMLLAQYSGALLFLQAQHQFSISQLKKLLPNIPIRHLLLKIATERERIGFYGTRKDNYQIKEVSNGFFLNGQLKWITGLNYLTKIFFSFNFEGNHYSTLLPFQARSDEQGEMQISLPMKTAIFESTNTVSIELRNWFIAKDNILSIQKIHPSMPSEHPTIYTFAGVTKSLLDMSLSGRYASSDKVKSRHQTLFKAWQGYCDEIMNGQHNPLILRAKGAALANKCAQFARMVCASDSLLAEHPLNRLAREIWQYTIAGYHQDQLEAYLEV